MSKYTLLMEYLAEVPEEVHEFSLSFERIEEIIQKRLPPSAVKSPKWWSNEVNGQNDQVEAWRQTGWFVKFVEVPDKWVKFWRDGLE
jgi:hypothetical protein